MAARKAKTMAAHATYPAKASSGLRWNSSSHFSGSVRKRRRSGQSSPSKGFSQHVFLQAHTVEKDLNEAQSRRTFFLLLTCLAGCWTQS